MQRSFPKYGIMLNSALFVLALGFSGSQPPLHCAATLEVIKGSPAATLEYAGAIFGTCCAGCDAVFMKAPKSLIAKAALAGKTIGVFEYDPVTGVKIDAKTAPAYSDYKAIRYTFSSAAEKKSFDSAPEKYVGDVKAESYSCPVTPIPMESSDTGGYGDYKGVRYYLCCQQCTAKFRRDPAKYVVSVKASVKPLAVTAFKKP